MSEPDREVPAPPVVWRAALAWLLEHDYPGAGHSDLDGAIDRDELSEAMSRDHQEPQ